MSFQQPPAPKNRGKTPAWATGIGFVIVVGFIVWAVASGGSSGSSPSTETNSPVPLLGAVSPTQQAAPTTSSSHTVVYAVGGTAKKADITFTTDGSTSTSQEMGARVPWTTTLNVPDGALNLYQVEAQNDGSGSVTCTITVDGHQVKTVAASGAYAIASCTSS
jgi:hypothetical protein